MEFAIGIGIGVVIALITGGRKKRSKSAAKHTETPDERKRRETDEIITVILPTINSDK